MKKVAVIGAGPAGMTAAITAARNGAKVTVFERNNIAGKKLLLTGNGRCNFTNVDMHTDYFSVKDGTDAAFVLESLTAKDVCDFFMDLGVLNIERKGCFYPFTGQAQTIQSALLQAMEHLGIELIYNTCVGKIDIKNVDTGSLIKSGEDINENNHENIFVIHTDEQKYEFDAVILCCGGKAAPKTGSDGFGYRLARGFGHTVSRTYPVLVQLVSDESNLKTVAGVRCQANVTALINDQKVASDYGELQMTEYGLSGIPVFHLSRFLSKEIEEGQKCEVSVDFIPQVAIQAMDGFVLKRIADLKGYRIKDILSGLVHSKVAEYVMKQRNISADSVVVEADKDRITELLLAMKEWKFHITGHKGFEHAQVTKGGVLLEEIDVNMESKLVKGLFFAGEMTDVDADCGGYNLHWAWASGIKAGEMAAK